MQLAEKETRGARADGHRMTEEASILLVEDERAIAEAVALNLREEGYHVDTAFRGEDGLRLAASGGYDLILLDLMLPGVDGRDICRAIRKKSQTPILMLT